MKHIVCYSGGHSSAIVAIEAVRKYGKDNVILVNHECILEDNDVARFEKEVANYLGLPITYVSFDGADTKDQFDVVIEKGSFINPNGQSREALCTHVMKTEPFMKWLFSNFFIQNTLFDFATPCTIYYGFDKEETDRILRRSTIMAAHGYKTAFPIAHWEERTIENTREIGIEPPNSYNVYKHANCVGCLKAGWQHWYCVYVLNPEIFEKGKMAEDKIGHSIHRDFYLEEKEEMFAKMVKCGIEPTERIPSQTWWAMVKKVLKDYDNTVCEVEIGSEKPCVCFN
jgi:hypothetical protein